MFSPTFEWILRALAWDGALPILVILTTLFARIGLQGQEEIQGLILILTPLAFAFLRAHLAYGQICRVCHGNAPILRQVALAAAIVCLLVFEVLVSILSWVKQPPLEVWVIPAGCYLVYLALILWALRPVKLATTMAWQPDTLTSEA